MSAARIIPFPTSAPTVDLPHALDAFSTTAHVDPPLVTTVIVTPAPSEGWVPPLSQRYLSVFESFAHWAAAERVGEDRVIR